MHGVLRCFLLFAFLLSIAFSILLFRYCFFAIAFSAVQKYASLFVEGLERDMDIFYFPFR